MFAINADEVDIEIKTSEWSSQKEEVGLKEVLA
jgi:hypothetical protein